MQVPFLDLAAQAASLQSELVPAVNRALVNARYVLGPEVTAFEGELAKFLHTGFAIGVNSGSDALTLALRALEIGPGDEVITTPFTYIAPAEAIHQNGARIVFADIVPETFNLDPADVARKLTPRTKAIIAVHLFGQPANISGLQQLGDKRIFLVEDCAQSIGSTWRDKPVGGFGAAGCFSFYPTKNLGAAGDGGMIVTQDEALHKRLRMLRVHGIERRYYHDLHGFNSRLDEIQAAVLRVKLGHLSAWNGRRKAIARRYDEGLEDLPVVLPKPQAGNDHVYHVYAILTPRRDEVQQFLSERGVSTLIYYPLPLHLQRVYQDLNYREGDFPVAEDVSRRILPLPIYPEMPDAHVDYVCDVLRQFPWK